MILWLTGNSGAGKTTLALQLASPKTVILDGDALRDALDDFDMTDEGRYRNNMMVARLALMFESQGFDVIVSVICPKESTRGEIKLLTNCVFIYLPYVGDDYIPNKPYERPTNADITLPERMIDVNQEKCLLGDRK